MSITRTMLMGVGAQQANQGALEAIADNVIKAQVEGTTRKIVTHRSLIGAGGQGEGMELAKLGRHVDASLQRDVFVSHGEFSYIEKKTLYLESMQQSLGRLDGPDNFGLLISELADSIHMLSTNPLSSAGRGVAIEKGDALARKLNKVSVEIQAARAQTDKDIANNVREIQDIINKISYLNGVIQSRHDMHSFTENDLLDERDRLVTQLSSFVNVHVVSRSDGSIVVSTAGGQALVNVESATMSYNGYDGYMSPQTNYQDDFNPITVAGVDITSSITSGKIKSLLELRDKLLPNMQDEIDHLAALIRDEVNAIHNEGVGTIPPQTLQGQKLLDGDLSHPLVSTGSFRIAFLDKQGNFAQFSDITTDSMTSVGELIDAINTGMGPDTATLDSQNRLVLKAPDGSGVALGAVDGSPSCKVTMGGKSIGISHYFGLNDFFVTNDKTIGESQVGLSQKLSVNPALKTDESRLSLTTLYAGLDATIPPAGTVKTQRAIVQGDAVLLSALSKVLTEKKINIPAVGILGQQVVSIVEYSNTLIAQHAQEAKTAISMSKELKTIYSQTTARLSNSSGINLHEELGLMNIYRQSYYASMRVAQIAQEMIDYVVRGHRGA